MYAIRSYYDGDGRGIAGEYGVWRTNVIELGKEGAFQLFIFANGFDHHLGMGECLEVYGGIDAG